MTIDDKLKKEIEGQIIDIVSEGLGKEKSMIKRESVFTTDLEADSLDLMELIIKFEEKYGLEIGDEDAAKIRTVGQAIDYVIDNYKPK